MLISRSKGHHSGPDKDINFHAITRVLHYRSYPDLCSALPILARLNPWLSRQKEEHKLSQEWKVKIQGHHNLIKNSFILIP